MSDNPSFKSHDIVLPDFTIHSSCILFFLFPLIDKELSLSNTALFSVSLLLGLLLHEMTHLTAARFLSIPLRTSARFVLYPSGLYWSPGRIRSVSARALFYFSAPLVNLIVASYLFVVPLGGIIPLDFSQFSTQFFWCILWFGGVNLIPLLPLDCGQFVNALKVRRKTKQRREGRRYEEALSVVLIVLAALTQSFALITYFVVIFLFSLRNFFETKALRCAQSMRVRQVMRDAEQIDQFQYDTSIETALVKIEKSFQDYFPVTKNGALVGMIERTTILRAHSEQAFSRIGELLMEACKRSTPDSNLYDLLRESSMDNPEPVVVVENDQFVGMVNTSKLFHTLAVRAVQERE